MYTPYGCVIGDSLYVLYIAFLNVGVDRYMHCKEWPKDQGEMQNVFLLTIYFEAGGKSERREEG